MTLERLLDTERRADAFLDSLRCKDPRPYPEARVTGPNPDYGRLLLDAYADGEAAELTAITQYIHHHITIDDPEIKNLELCISMVEMKHLMLLGELINQLGLDPKYWRGNTGYWNGSQVMYGADVCEQLKMDIESEQAAINAYHRLLSQISDPGVTRVLERILADEEVHLSLFLDALNRCSSGGWDEPER